MNPSKLILPTSLLIATVAGQAGHAVESKKDGKPNIIVILADDLGYSDLGCYGGEIHTPNLDRLANNGLRFNNFYNASRSCPTRASLLTGLYPHQAGIGLLGTSPMEFEEPGYKDDLSHHAVTLPEVLKQAGYATYITGKWHIAKDMSATGDKSNWPCQRGFDRYFGTLNGSGSYYDPSTLISNNTFITTDSVINFLTYFVIKFKCEFHSLSFILCHIRDLNP